MRSVQVDFQEPSLSSLVQTATLSVKQSMEKKNQVPLTAKSTRRSMIRRSLLLAGIFIVANGIALLHCDKIGFQAATWLLLCC